MSCPLTINGKQFFVQASFSSSFIGLIPFIMLYLLYFLSGSHLNNKYLAFVRFRGIHSHLLSLFYCFMVFLCNNIISNFI